jgi:TonB-linked SusC/RagA family outer membrane protein
MKQLGLKSPVGYRFAFLRKGLAALKTGLLVFLMTTISLVTSASGANKSGMLSEAGDPSSGTAVTEQVQKKITGTVTDAKGQPLAGVTVTVKGTTAGALTDSKGSYEVNAPANSTSLVFSFVGMKTQEIVIGNSATVDALLQEDLLGLEEVVVIGYGTSKKEDLSAAIASVPRAESLKSRPLLSTASAIQGIIPGVTVVNQGGHPDRAPSITIRGIGSQSEGVLYVVDGVPGAPYNPEDIESITILKDAASAAIYGAYAGSAGVILITTKQAKEGKPTVEYSGFYGVKQAWNLPQSLRAEDEARVARLAYTNAGLTSPAGWDAATNPYAQVTRTDWVDEITRVAPVQRHTITVNSGTDKMSNLFQVRYENDEGTLLNTYNNNISLRYNANYKFNKYVSFREEMFWNNNDRRGTDTESGYSGTILSAIYMPRSATAYYDDGTFGGVGPRNDAYLGIHGDAINPVASLLRNQAYNKSSNVISTSELRVTGLIKGLDISSRFSYSAANSLYKSFSPMRTEPGKPNARNSLDYSTGKSFGWIWENTINYSRVFGKHNIGAMVASTAKEDGYRGFSVSGKDFGREDEWAQFFVNAGTFSENRPSDGQWEARNMSYVGRLSYSYADRYFLTGSYRADIAGRLAAGNRTKTFPGVTAAWKLTSEPWFKIEGLDLIKFRASWGRIGNLGAIGLYYGYPNLSSNNTYQIGLNAPLATAAYVASAYNSTLSWETSEQTDFGLDMAFFNRRLSIVADYFKKVTFDLIKQQDTEWTYSYGVDAPYINKGEITNSGIEFQASWNDKVGDLTYGVSGNFATLKNEVTYIDESATAYWIHGNSWRGILTPYRSTVGQPYYSYWLVQNEGIFQSQEEVDAYTYTNPSTGAITKIQPYAKAGDLKFKDQDGNGSIGDGDRVYMGNAFPKLTYGFSGNLGWKNWDLSLFFQGVSGVKLFNAFKESTLNAAEQGYNRWDKILDAWSPTNTGSDIPVIRVNDPNKNFGTSSDWFLEKGDYLRLKNLLIGYTFKNLPWDGKIKVYFSGENLMTFTKYSGMDPEVGGVGFDGGQYPVSRILSFGANINF